MKTERTTAPTENQTAAGGALLDASVHGTDGTLDIGFPNTYFPEPLLWREVSAFFGMPLYFHILTRVVAVCC